tara:strand:+ start:175 stop:516 length:342 start_codon:yes stop_codon:yes gene_type:complete
VEKKWKEWDEVKQRLYGTRYDIMLKDEAPRIGSGFRSVYVKEGRKWAYMTSHLGNPEDKEGKVVKRFTLKAWRNLKASHERFLERNDPDAVAQRLSRRRYRKIQANPRVLNQN